MSYSLIQSEGNDCYKSYVAHSLIQSEGNDCYKSYVAHKWYKVYPVKLNHELARVTNGFDGHIWLPEAIFNSTAGHTDDEFTEMVP